MKKLLNSLTLLVAFGSLSTLAGCELYFGGHGDKGGSWNYCGSDGYYQCQGDNCTWVSATCPAGTGSGSGYECSVNTDCAAGCYCASGTCTEAGFCSSDNDCGTGYHCDTDRSSCEPTTTSCTSDSQCAAGSSCQNGSCTATCTCSNDQDAINAGFGWCDESRSTCMTGEDPAGSCASDVTCSDAMPSCPAGQVALSLDGCWTGQCRALDSCDLTPVCKRINDETDCLARSDCGGIYNGLNCTKPDNTACHSGDANCTCTDFVFASCASRTP